MTEKNEGIVRGFFSILIPKIGTTFLTIVITPIIVRILTRSQYGTYSFVLSFLAILMIFVTAGTTAGVRKYIAEDRELPNWKGHIFGFYFRIAISLAILGSLAIIFALRFGYYEPLFGSNVGKLVVYLPFMVITEQIFGIFRNTLMGLNMEEYSEPLKVLQKVLFASVGIGLAYFGWGVRGFLIGHIIANGVAAIIAIGLLARHLSFAHILSSLPSEISGRNLISFNIKTILLIFLTASLTHIDILMIQTLTGSTQTAYYRAALTIAEFLLFVPILLQMKFLHSASSLWSRGDISRINTLSANATRYNLLLTVLLAIGMSALAEEFIGLYFGQAYLTAVGPMLLLLPGVVGYALARPIFAIGQGKGELKMIIIATGVSAVLNVVLNALLIPLYGITGAGIATSIGYGSMFIFHVYSARVIGYDPIHDLRVVRVLAAAISSGIVIHLISRIVTNSVLSLLIIPPIGFTVYAYVAVLVDAIDEREVHGMISLVPAPIENIFRQTAIRVLPIEAD